MSFPTQINQTRSKLKRKCKLQSSKSFNKQTCLFQKPKMILSHILQIDYGKETKPQQIKPSQVETYGALTELQLKDIFQKFISRELLQRIIIDAMKLCYLYTPIMQAIETQLESTRQEYKVKDVLFMILNGNFYQFLTMKTQPPKYLVNNKSTEVNVQTIVSGIVSVVGNKLTVQNLSDVVLYYRLEEALYQTAPFGLPFQFEKIIKAMKKIDRNITADKFTKWQKKMHHIEKDIRFLEPFHFVYLMSLSEPMSKKRQNMFEVDRKESKFQKQSQLMSIMKEKNNFINFEKRKSNWRSEIKVRGLSFQENDQSKKIATAEKNFVDLRKRIISHKRVKSAYITGKAVEMVKKDLIDKNLKQNEYLLDTGFLYKKQPQNERKLLKKHNHRSQALKQFEKHRSQQHHKFTYLYFRQLKNHKHGKPQNEQSKDSQQSLQHANDKNLVEENDEHVVDIYSHHLTKILANTKCRSYSRGMGGQRIEQNQDKMLMWL